MGDGQEGVELHWAPLSPAPRNSRWQVEVSFGRARELKAIMHCEMNLHQRGVAVAAPNGGRSEAGAWSIVSFLRLKTTDVGGQSLLLVDSAARSWPCSCSLKKTSSGRSADRNHPASTA